MADAVHEDRVGFFASFPDDVASVKATGSGVNDNSMIASSKLESMVAEIADSDILPLEFVPHAQVSRVKDSVVRTIQRWVPVTPTGHRIQH